MSAYRFYAALTLGDGLSRATAFRSKLSNFIVNDGTQDFWDWSNRAWPRRFCLAFCASTVHTSIAADPDIVPLSPELADVPAVTTWLDTPIASFPAGIATGMEAGGIPVDWVVVGVTTPRQIWRFVAGWHFIVQRFNGAGDGDGFAFMKANLDNTVSQVPVAVRNRIAAWMANNGIDASWIMGSTPVRAVVKSILQNGDFHIMQLGPVAF